MRTEPIPLSCPVTSGREPGHVHPAAPITQTGPSAAASCPTHHDPLCPPRLLPPTGSAWQPRAWLSSPPHSSSLSSSAALLCSPVILLILTHAPSSCGAESPGESHHLVVSTCACCIHCSARALDPGRNGVHCLSLSEYSFLFMLRRVECHRNTVLQQCPSPCISARGLGTVQWGLWFLSCQDSH